jgi:HAD superfamily hydrolase (TIGR01509 family)
MIKVILFDFDGVLTAMNMEELFSYAVGLDIPEKKKMGAFWKAYVEFGARFPGEHPYCEKFYRMVDSETGKKMDRDFAARFRAKLKMNFEKGLPGILEHLHEKYKLAIFTGGKSAAKRKALEEAGLWKYFEAVFPLDEKIAPKPHPGVYKQAESTMGAHGQEILLVDDNIVRGIFGAKQHGWKTCFVDKFKYFPTENVPADLRPDFTIKSLRELKARL